MKRIVLLDTHALIHRAYHALPDFRASDGTPTGALYGLSNMIASIIRDLKPDYIFACYDLPGKTFRHEAYTEYKGTRKAGDDDLITQLISSREIINALNIPIIDAVGYEADDVIGTLAKKFSDKNKYDIIIASGDMDTMQLIEDKHVRVFTLKKGITETVLIDEDAVIERFGFPPKYIADYKGLRGDASDNIPGVPGIGEKTASNLISNFQTIENLYKVLNKNSDDVKSVGVTDRIIGILKDNEEGAIFSKMLATIRTDVPIDAQIPEKVWSDDFDKEKSQKIFLKYEFRNMMSRFDPNYVKPTNTITKNTANIVKSKKSESVESKTIKSNQPDLFSEPVDKTKLEEARLMVWLLNSDRTNADISTILIDAGADNFDEAHKLLKERLQKEKSLLWLYENVEHPLINIVEKMSQHGIKLDVPYLKDFSESITKELKKIESEIVELAGEDFNVNSPKQLSHILFVVLNLSTKGLKKRKDGLYSTDIDTLSKLANDHPIINKMLVYREKEKLRSTYIDAWLGLVDKNDSIHPTFILTGAATGRFASTNPGVQNIPIGGNYGTEIRRGFVARSGYTLMAFDYSQIELRIAALLSQDEYLLKVFTDGRDIHNEVASRVFGVSSSEVTKDMRRRAKVINFGILYGMGSTALAKEIGITRTEAKDMIDKYFSQFPKIAQYMDKVITDAKRLGYTETLFGRRRQIPGLKSNAPFIRAMAERMATNAPIQGTATADIIRIAMVNIEKSLKENKLDDKIFPILQIHDELVFEVQDEYIDQAKVLIKEIMEQGIDKKFLGNLKPVPIIAECHIGKNWGDMV
jgi:DNA polymerase-1